METMIGTKLPPISIVKLSVKVWYHLSAPKKNANGVVSKKREFIVSYFEVLKSLIWLKSWRTSREGTNDLPWCHGIVTVYTLGLAPSQDVSGFIEGLLRLPLLKMS